MHFLSNVINKGCSFMKCSLLWFFLSVLVAHSAAADELSGKLKAIAESKTIVIGHHAQNIPFSFIDPNGVPLGYSIDLCKQVVVGLEQQLNLPKIDIKYVALTSSNRFEMVRQGQVDIECGSSTNTISRQKIVDFSLMTWVDGGSFAVKGEKPVHGLADMAGKRIGVLKGNTTEIALKGWMKKHSIEFELVPVTSHMDGIQQLNKGTIDAYAADQTVLLGLSISSANQMKISIATTTFSYEPYGLMIARNDADFKQAVNRVLANLYRSGEILNIYNTWFGKLGKPSPALTAMYEINGLPE